MAFELTILGSGAATPTLQRASCAHYLRCENFYYLIDCGEGTQIQLLRFGLSMFKIDAVFISHLHGDHYLGLPGLISSMHLSGRLKPLYIYAPGPLEEIIRRQFELTQLFPKFELIFKATSATPLEHLHSNDLLDVFSFPLKHRVFCAGFLFKEKKKARIINPIVIKELQIPEDKINAIKYGEDFITESGERISHYALTFDAKPNHSFAYCSDTAYFEELPKWISGVNLLYHEATFGADKEERAAETFHSTAHQAAKQARDAAAKELVIGHFSPRYSQIEVLEKEAIAIFPDTKAAFDGMKIKTKD